jgi:O-methyltransferase involved in polyketide biosynthesis
MVMLWARPIYGSGMASRLVGALDMSGGEELCRRGEESCFWYPEIIRNRKYFIAALASACVKKAGQCQVVVPAAGMSPIALELIECCGEHILRAFEMDLAGMEEKQKLYRQLFPGLSKSIECLSLDIREKRTIEVLSEHGYDISVPSVVIMEGISYYLSREELLDVLGIYRSPGRDNVVIIEYLLPCNRVREDRQYIPLGEFDMIKRYCSLPLIQTYRKETLSEILGRHNGTIESHHTMCEMERARLGSQVYFREPGDWWIECLAIRI